MENEIRNGATSPTQHFTPIPLSARRDTTLSPRKPSPPLPLGLETTPQQGSSHRKPVTYYAPARPLPTCCRLPLPHRPHQTHSCAAAVRQACPPPPCILRRLDSSVTPPKGFILMGRSEVTVPMISAQLQALKSSPREHRLGVGQADTKASACTRRYPRCHFCVKGCAACAR